MMSSVKELKASYSIHIWYAQYNNAGESEDFKWMCKQEWMNIPFEYTIPGT